jgi:DNA (cytosine-5)-methyltransferase 1
MDKYCKLVLQKHWKGVKIYNDVREITKARFEADGIELPEIITGGFPCQPFSVAGKQKGTSDDRHLWPEMFRIIKEFKPRWVIGENVKGITNIQDGMVFETVCTDLEGEGYEVRAFNIPAAGVGAPHRRERIWIVAHAKRFNDSESIEESDGAQDQVQKEHRQNDSASRLTSGTSSVWQSNDGHEDVAHSNDTRNRTPKHEINKDGQKTDERRQEQSQLKSSGHSKDVENSRRTLRQGSEFGKTNEDETRKEDADQHQRSSSPSKSDVANTESSNRHDHETITGDGESQTQEVSRDRSSLSGEGSWWQSEPDVGRVAHGVPGRVHRLKALGNSIVPKIAEEIGKAIIEAERVE